jgi:hypothetical protein
MNPAVCPQRTRKARGSSSRVRRLLPEEAYARQLQQPNPQRFSIVKHIPAHLTAIAGLRFNLPALLLLTVMRSRDREQGG